MDTGINACTQKFQLVIRERAGYGRTHNIKFVALYDRMSRLIRPHAKTDPTDFTTEGRGPVPQVHAGFHKRRSYA
jgi:hypothetical protein